MSLNQAEWRWDDVRARSVALFGSPHRLRVALLASLAEGDELYAARIARAAQIDNKEAVRELAHFEAAELLVEVSRAPATTRRRGRPARLLERHDEEAWAALQALGERFRRPPPGRSGAQR
jgi:predicted ArsR family transcriptional regulator